MEVESAIGVESPGSAIVAARPINREAMGYDWDAPALGGDGMDLTPAQKDTGMETLRPDRVRLVMYLIGGIVAFRQLLELSVLPGWYVGALAGAPIGLLLGHSINGLLFRPHYCSTNKNGIRIPSTVGPCALRWNAITSLERRRCDLVLGSGESMRVTTVFCKRSDVDALVDRIVDRAQLVPNPARKNRWIHRSAPELSSPKLAGREL